MSEILRRSERYKLGNKDLETFKTLLENEIGSEAVLKMTEEDIISAACFFLSVTEACYNIQKREKLRESTS